MKRLILKTALITVCSALVLLIALFGLMSVFAPATMMRFTSSVGLYGMSGGYAYSAYQKTGDISYLAYSCEAAASSHEAGAKEKYELFFSLEGFADYCRERDEAAAESLPGGVAQYMTGSYEQFSYGNYACVLLRAGDGEGAIAFVMGKLDASFPESNAAVSLAMEGISLGNKQFCEELAQALRESSAAGQVKCQEIISILEEFANE